MVAMNQGGLPKIEVQISHIKEDPLFASVKPYMILQSGALDIPKTNCSFNADCSVLVHDLGDQSSKEFDTCGFVYLKNVACSTSMNLDSFANDSTNRSTLLLTYLEDTKVFVEDYFKAERAICFDWRLRAHSRSHNSTDEKVSLKRLDIVPPAFKAHAGGLGTVEAYLSPDELKAFHRDEFRIRIINCWRPLVDLVQDVPLAMCDRKSVLQDDWLPYDRIDESSVGEGMWLKYRPWHRWYWLPNMSKRDVVLFQSWDSETLTFEGQTPHAAFEYKAAEVGFPPRASIEVRLMVFTRSSQEKYSG